MDLMTLPKLEKFVKSELDRKLTMTEIESLLRGISLQPSDYKKFVKETTEKYFRNSIALSQFAELLVMTWLPMQQSPIHDHADSDCCIRVLQGRMTETLYSELAQNQNEVIELSSTVWERDTVTSSVLENIHKVSNTHTPVLVTLHLYSPPLQFEKMRIFKETRAFASLVSQNAIQPSSASPER